MKKIILSIFCMILLISCISAVLDIKNFDEEFGEHGKIKIKNWLFFKKADYTLIDYGDSIINAWAEGEVKLYKKTHIFSGVKFKNLIGNYESLSSVKFLVLIQENYSIKTKNFTLVCDDIDYKNGTIIETCENVQNGYKYENKTKKYWKEYSKNEKKEEGTYRWRLEAKKIPNQKVDFILEAQGKNFDEWAWWDTDFIRKKQINFSTSTGETGINYSLRLNVTYDNDMNANFTDLRFINGNENDELGYWLNISGTVNGSYADVYVRINNSINTTNQSIYMYYNNVGASTTSSCPSAFLFCDLAQVNNIGNWSTNSEPSGSNSPVIPSLKFNNNLYNITVSPNKAGWVYSPYNLTTGTVEVLTDARQVSGINNGQWGIGYRRDSNFATAMRFGQVVNFGLVNMTTSSTTYINNSGGGTSSDTQFHSFSYIINTSSNFHNATINGPGLSDEVTSTSKFWYGNPGFHFFMNGGTNTMEFKNFIIRTYSENIPTSFFGQEQANDQEPTITLNAPVNDLKSSTQTIIFNATGVDDFLLQNMSFILNGSYNGTNSSVLNNTLTQFSRTLDDGFYNWTVEVCDNSSQCINATSRNFTIDSNLPEIKIIFPIGEIDSFSIGDSLNLNWSINDTNLDSCWFNYNSTNTTVTCSDNATTFIPVSNLQNLTMWANDTSGNINSDFTNWTYGFLENNVTFNAFVNETSSEDFIINLSTDITILSISALLNYDSNTYISTVSCVNSDCTLENNIDIPLVSSGENENKTFFWQIIIFNGTDSLEINTTTRNQNVSRIHLEACNGTFSDDSINFTAYDEQTLAQFNTFNFNGTFEFWIGDGTVKRNNSFINTSKEFTICISPNAEMKIDAVIDYDQNGASNYTSRFYYLDDFIINSTKQDIKMYLLDNDESTSFILKVQDDSLLPVDEALIEIHRYYPGEGIFRIVQISKTDDNGKSIGFFVTETVDYKFIIKKGSEILLETGQQKVIPETSPFTLTFNTGEPLNEPWNSQEDLDNLNSSLIWDNNTNIVTYTYIDTSENFTLARLLVVKENLVNSTNDTIICNVNLSISSGTLNCNVGSVNGFYVASSFITRNTETLDKQFTFQIETLSGVVGLLGLFYGWFLILIASFMFKFNEIAGIWAITITLFMVNLMGLINFGGVFVTSTIAVALILTWIMER